MIGDKKLSTIRAELKAALAAERSNPIAALDKKIRKLNKQSSSDQTRSLVLLRGALAQLAHEPTQRRRRVSRTKHAKRAVSRP